LIIIVSVGILQNRKTGENLYAFNAAASSCRRASFSQHFYRAACNADAV